MIESSLKESPMIIPDFLNSGAVIEFASRKLINLKLDAYVVLELVFQAFNILNLIYFCWTTENICR